MPLFVITCHGGHDWLVRASTASAAAKKWQRCVERNEAEPARHISVPEDRTQITYLREIGQADPDA